MKRWQTPVTLLAILLLAIGLRFWQLGELPAWLYWEEAALGYDAFSIVKTGADHHGRSWPLAAFESFGDWKPSGYFYALLPFIRVFGLNHWLVRAPAAISGVMIVIGIAYLVILSQQLYLFNSKSKVNPAWAMFLSAVSPWAILFSRAAWEVNLAVALLLWGVILFFKFLLIWRQISGGQTKHRKDWLRLWAWLLSSVLLLVLSMYTYHAARIIAPLLGLGLAVLTLQTPIRWKQVKLVTAVFLPVIIAAIGLLWPIVTDLQSGTASQRFRETSLFYRLDIIEESNARRAAENYSLISRIYYHRYLLFGREIISNYLTYVNFDYLFLSGDVNPRHSVQYFGQLYHLGVVLLLLGIYYLIKRQAAFDRFLLWWLVVGLLPAAVSLGNPHALRSLFVLPVIIYTLAAGITQLTRLCQTAVSRIKLLDFKPSQVTLVMSALLAAGYLMELGLFWHHYTGVYVHDNSASWQAGYKPLVEQLHQAAENQPQLPIFVTREQGRPAMYYWFYSQTDPHLVQAQASTAAKDQGEFLEFANIRFIDHPQQLTAPAIVASSPDFHNQLSSKFTTKPLTEVMVDGQTPVWQIYTIN